MIKYFNFIEGNLADAVSDSATSITVVADTLPTLDNGDWFYIVLDYKKKNGDPEIVKVTDVTGDVLTIERGCNGTIARAHNSAITFAHGVLAEDIENVAYLDEAQSWTAKQVFTGELPLVTSDDVLAGAEFTTITEWAGQDGVVRQSVIGSRIEISPGVVVSSMATVSHEIGVDEAPTGRVAGQTVSWGDGTQPAASTFMLNGLGIMQAFVGGANLPIAVEEPTVDNHATTKLYVDNLVEAQALEILRGSVFATLAADVWDVAGAVAAGKSSILAGPLTAAHTIDVPHPDTGLPFTLSVFVDDDGMPDVTWTFDGAAVTGTPVQPLTRTPTDASFPIDGGMNIQVWRMVPVADVGAGATWAALPYHVMPDPADFATAAQGALADTAVQPEDHLWSQNANVRDVSNGTYTILPTDGVLHEVGGYLSELTLPSVNDVPAGFTLSLFGNSFTLTAPDGNGIYDFDLEAGTAINTPLAIPGSCRITYVNGGWLVSGIVSHYVKTDDIGTAAAADTGDFATAAQGSTADTAVQPGDLPSFGDIVTADSADFIVASEKGATNGVAELVDGVVPSVQLPGYVDDVLDYANLAAFPGTGEAGKIYVAIDTNLAYRWTGSAYGVISPSLALGETSATAYRGDRGKTAYDHSQVTTGNPHGTTAADIGAVTTGDSRLTDARTPTAHKTSHATGGSDLLLPSDIGAVPTIDMPRAASWSGARVGPLGLQVASAGTDVNPGFEYWVPVWVPAGTYTDIAVFSTVAQASTWRLGIYDHHANFYPTTVLLDAGTVNMASTAGLQALTISFVNTTARWLWLSVKITAYTATPTVTTMFGDGAGGGAQILGWPARTNTLGYSGLYATSRGTGALATAPTFTATNPGPRSYVPKITMLRS